MYFVIEQYNFYLVRIKNVKFIITFQEYISRNNVKSDPVHYIDETIFLRLAYQGNENNPIRSAKNALDSPIAIHKGWKRKAGKDLRSLYFGFKGFRVLKSNRKWQEKQLSSSS